MRRPLVKNPELPVGATPHSDTLVNDLHDPDYTGVASGNAVKAKGFGQHLRSELLVSGQRG
jgi:hypothetical protein